MTTTRGITSVTPCDVVACEKRARWKIMYLGSFIHYCGEHRRAKDEGRSPLLRDRKRKWLRVTQEARP